jgi:hypothetical protein
MSHHKSSRELHGEHEDARNEAAIRVGAIRRMEDHARHAYHARLVNALVQRPEPHHFHDAIVRPISPRRGWGFPDEPGGTDSTDFLPGGIV